MRGIICRDGKVYVFRTPKKFYEALDILTQIEIGRRSITCGIIMVTSGGEYFKFLKERLEKLADEVYESLDNYIQPSLKSG